MPPIKCPWCGAKVIEATEFTVSYFDPKFNCKRCKQSGTLSWSAGDEASTTRAVKEKEKHVASNKGVRRKA